MARAPLDSFTEIQSRENGAEASKDVDFMPVKSPLRRMNRLPPAQWRHPLHLPIYLTAIEYVVAAMCLEIMKG